jgi:alpha-N-arabinofuranosidase
VHDEVDGTLTFFAVNRHGTEKLDIEFSLQGFARPRSRSSGHGASKLEAVNTATDQNNVVPKKERAQ